MGRGAFTFEVGHEAGIVLEVPGRDNRAGRESMIDKPGSFASDMVGKQWPVASSAGSWGRSSCLAASPVHSESWDGCSRTPSCALVRTGCRYWSWEFICEDDCSLRLLIYWL